MKTYKVDVRLTFYVNTSEDIHTVITDTGFLQETLEKELQYITQADVQELKGELDPTIEPYLYANG